MLFKLLSLFNRDFEASLLNLSSMNIFVLFILGYVLYRFIGGFLIPLFRTTRHVHQQFTNMNKNGQDGQRSNSSSQGFNAQPGERPTGNPPSQGSGGQGGQQKTSNSGNSKVGEYIDFEEIH
jgi:hypothetical protein